MKEQLFKMIFYFEADAISGFEVIQWAMNQVVLGNGSDSVNKLASLTRDDKEEVRLLLKQAVADQGDVYPSQSALGVYRAKLVSEEMVRGKIPPLKGCAIIGRIGSQLEGMEIFNEFSKLSRDVKEHGELGISDELIINERIISASHKLIEDTREYLAMD